MKRLLTVVRAAGAAASLAPVHKAYEGPKNLLAYDGALTTLRAANLEPDGVITAFAPDRVPDRRAPTALLTGTSFAADDDALWWAWAREQGSPSTAFVDQASSYRERFTPSWGSFLEPGPDRIGVVDEAMRREIVAQGAPPAAVHVVGQPAYDPLHDVTPGRRAQARAALGVGPQTCVALWIGEPPPPPRTIAEDKALRGYTESETVRLAHAAFAACAPDRLFLVRPHPVHQATGGAPAPCADDVRMDHGAKLDALAAADVVIGQTSTALLEAWMLGVPVLSLQPGRLAPSPVTDGRPGLRVVTAPEDIGGALRGALAQGRRPPHPPERGAAARKLLDLAMGRS